MSAEGDNRHRLIESIVQEALDLPAEQRLSHVATRCGGDAALRAAVELLMAPSDDELHKFLNAPAVRRRRDGSSDATIPAKIGRYEIIRPIGEGGMGMVYEARQDQPRRTVALKVIRPGMASRGLLRRFEHEAEILGQLQHPGIACIYEAGVAEVEVEPREGMRLPPAQQPFFAMEFVRGRPITEYVLQKSLDVRERLELFAKVCDAVQHAHQKGVIHRDLKPANILVVESEEATELRSHEGRTISAETSVPTSLHGPVASPKILDFGVARVTNADLQTMTLKTDVGQLIGTIPYMSPEQVSGDSRQLDTRSDVYALGVILYEMLATRLPHNFHNCSIPESMRIIREDEPSRLGSINTHYRGDIETIVAKSIEKDKHRRYASAAELAADVRRFLRDEPIVARPTSRYYRFRKFARRHTGIVLGISAAILSLSVGLTLALWQWSIATRARDSERLQRQLADSKAEEAQRQAYRASLAAAQAAIHSDDIAMARHSLGEAAPALRGWEWSYFHRLADPPAITLPSRGRLRAATVSYDGGRVFAQTWDSKLHVWDSALRQVIHTFPADTENGWVAAPDGKSVAIAMPADVTMYDAATGQRVWRRALRGRLTLNSFRRDGAIFAVELPAELRVALLDAHSGAEAASVLIPSLQTGWPNLGPDGSFVICSHGSFNDIFDVATGGHLFGFNGDGWSFTADGKRILTYGPIYEARTGKELKVFDQTVSGPGKRAERPDQTALANVNVRGVVTLFDAQTFQPIARLRAAGDYVFAYSGDGRKLITAGPDGTLVMTDASFVTLPMTVPIIHNEEVDSAAVGRIALGGRLHDAVATGSWGCVTLRDPLNGAPRWRRTVSHQDVNALAFSHNGRILAGAGWKGSVALLDAATGELLSQHIAGTEPDVWALAFSADDTELYVAFAGGIVRAAPLRVPAASMPKTRGFGALAATKWKSVFESKRGDVSALVTGPDGRLVAIGTGHGDTPRPYGTAPTTGDGKIEIWEAATGRQIRTIDAHRSSILSLVFDSASATIASASADGTVALWNIADGRRLMSLDGRAGAMYSVCLSPDGTRIAAGAQDGTIRLWDRATGRDLCGIGDVATAAVLALSFSADGRSLLGAAWRMPLIVLETAPPDCPPGEREWVARARREIDELSRRYSSRKILEKVRANTELPAPLREMTIKYCKAWGDNANWLNSDAWEGCAPPGAPLKQYEDALDLAEQAVALLPDAAILNTLGTAQYRVGRFREAIESLQRSDQMYSHVASGSQAANWLVIAMAQHRLHKDEAARKALARGRELMRDPKQGDDTDNRAFLQEADAMIGEPRQ